MEFIPIFCSDISQMSVTGLFLFMLPIPTALSVCVFLA